MSNSVIETIYREYRNHGYSPSMALKRNRKLAADFRRLDKSDSEFVQGLYRGYEKSNQKLIQKQALSAAKIRGQYRGMKEPDLDIEFDRGEALSFLGELVNHLVPSSGRPPNGYEWSELANLARVVANILASLDQYGITPWRYFIDNEDDFSDLVKEDYEFLLWLLSNVEPADYAPWVASYIVTELPTIETYIEEVCLSPERCQLGLLSQR